MNKFILFTAILIALAFPRESSGSEPACISILAAVQPFVVWSDQESGRNNRTDAILRLEELVDSNDFGQPHYEDVILIRGRGEKPKSILGRLLAILADLENPNRKIVGAVLNEQQTRRFIKSRESQEELFHRLEQASIEMNSDLASVSFALLNGVGLIGALLPLTLAVQSDPTLLPPAFLLSLGLAYCFEPLSFLLKFSNPAVAADLSLWSDAIDLRLPDESSYLGTSFWLEPHLVGSLQRPHALDERLMSRLCVARIARASRANPHLIALTEMSELTLEQLLQSRNPARIDVDFSVSRESLTGKIQSVVILRYGCP